MQHQKIQGDPLRKTSLLWYFLLGKYRVPRDIIKIILSDLLKDYKYRRENEARKYMIDNLCSDLSKFPNIEAPITIENCIAFIEFFRHESKKKFLEELSDNIADIRYTLDIKTRSGFSASLPFSNREYVMIISQSNHLYNVMKRYITITTGRTRERYIDWYSVGFVPEKIIKVKGKWTVEMVAKKSRFQDDEEIDREVRIYKDDLINYKPKAIFEN